MRFDRRRGHRDRVDRWLPRDRLGDRSTGPRRLRFSGRIAWRRWPFPKPRRPVPRRRRCARSGCSADGGRGRGV